MKHAKHTREQLIKLAKLHYGTEVRDNTVDQLQSIGAELEAEGCDISDYEDELFNYEKLKSNSRIEHLESINSEMLEALERIVDQIEATEHDSYENAVELSRVILMGARQAIAKAKGES